jgi:hypothetical protein
MKRRYLRQDIGVRRKCRFIFGICICFAMLSQQNFELSSRLVVNNVMLCIGNRFCYGIGLD